MSDVVLRCSAVVGRRLIAELLVLRAEESSWTGQLHTPPGRAKMGFPVCLCYNYILYLLVTASLACHLLRNVL